VKGQAVPTDVSWWTVKRTVPFKELQCWNSSCWLKIYFKSIRAHCRGSPWLNLLWSNSEVTCHYWSNKLICQRARASFVALALPDRPKLPISLGAFLFKKWKRALFFFPPLFLVGVNSSIIIWAWASLMLSMSGSHKGFTNAALLQETVPGKYGLQVSHCLP